MEGSEDSRLEAASMIQYAGFWMRFWAYLLDLIVIGSLNRILVYPVLRYIEAPLTQESMFAPAAAATAIVMYAYFTVMTKLFGQTLGKMVFGLKVLSERHEDLTWNDVLFREVIGKFISKTLLFIGFLAVAFSKKKKGFHDYFADTIVVLTKR
ncbi:RDD family protein [Bacillus marinisedimentorum]|uniref:RDD family protein n=1 Tax=Bacillus marinisedimentorum TaxID=1821260 RepID=UPI0007DFD1B6|nr:RDD family protein [Bacillus marinisedimentorum]